MLVQFCLFISGHEIVHNTGANATKFFTLATKSLKTNRQFGDYNASYLDIYELLKKFKSKSVAVIMY